MKIIDVREIWNVIRISLEMLMKFNKYILQSRLK